MGDAGYNGIPEWLHDTFGDPIWRHDRCPWRRHSYPVTAPDEFSDDSTDEFLRPDYPHSEPDRDLPEWSSPRHISPQGTEHLLSCHSAEAMVTDLKTIIERLADPYWADRGWVLDLIICWKETNANYSYRRRSDSSRRRSSKRTPPNSHHHSARRSSSSNWYVVDLRTVGGCG